MENNKTGGGAFKVISLIIVLAAIVFALIFLLPQTSKAVAELNGKQITQSEFNEKLSKTKDFIKGSGSTETITAEQEKELRKNILEGMINERLVADYAAENNLSVTNEELVAEYAKVVNSSGGEEALQTQLKKFNITKDQLNEDIRSALTFNKSVEKYVGAEKLVITEKEAKDTYNKLVEQSKTQNPASTEPIPSFEETKTMLMEQLRAQKINTESQALITFLRGKATIKTFLE